LNIVEDLLTKRPYAAGFVLALASTNSPKEIDTAKYTRECLKNITSEDLINYYYFDEQTLSDLESKYNNTNGTNFEHELSKIVQRYRNDGKPDIQQLELQEQENAE